MKVAIEKLRGSRASETFLGSLLLASKGRERVWVIIREMVRSQAYKW